MRAGQHTSQACPQSSPPPCFISWLTKCYQFILKFALTSSLWSHQTLWNILSFVLKQEKGACVAGGMGFHMWAKGTLRGSAYRNVRDVLPVPGKRLSGFRHHWSLASSGHTNDPLPMSPKENHLHHHHHYFLGCLSSKVITHNSQKWSAEGRRFPGGRWTCDLRRQF